MSVIHISNGTIIDIARERSTVFVTVRYRTRSQQKEQTVRLAAGPRTVVLNTNGTPIPAVRLNVGMVINASFSSAMTRSIPPQASAYFIRIVNQQPQDAVTIGRIFDVDSGNRSFSTISDQDFSTIILFHVPENAVIFNRSGRPVRFSALNRGMQVRVRHANYMTASLPPQTTAYEIRIL